MHSEHQVQEFEGINGQYSLPHMMEMLERVKVADKSAASSPAPSTASSKDEKVTEKVPEPEKEIEKTDDQINGVTKETTEEKEGNEPQKQVGKGYGLCKLYY